MNRKTIPMLICKKYIIICVTLSAMTLPVMPGFNTPAQAGDAGAFVGGMVAGHVVGGAIRRDKARTQAELEQAEYARQQASAPPPAPAAAPQPQQKTADQKLQELDKLAAGGYITPEEYKTKRQAILDSM
jgi:hypothetical protein